MSLALAAREAAKSQCRFKVGAVLVRGGRVLALGHNKARNNPAYIDIAPLQCSVHAEVAVLKQVEKTRGATIYVARVNRRGEWRLAKPCDHCAIALEDAGVSKVFYTT